MVLRLNPQGSLHVTAVNAFIFLHTRWHYIFIELPAASEVLKFGLEGRKDGIIAA